MVNFAHALQLAGAIFQLTFQDVPALQLLHIGSLAQPPAEKHQNHVLYHFSSLLCPTGRGLAADPCPIPLTPAPVSSLRSYVSISHPNRGCAASAEARPTFGTAAAKARSFPPLFCLFFFFRGSRWSFSPLLLMLSPLLLRCRCARNTPPALLLSAAEYERFF